VHERLFFGAPRRTRFLLGPEPGQARQIVSVDDNVAEPDGQVASMRGHAGLHRLLVRSCRRQGFLELA
jgi:hypothetical protein